MSTSRTTSRKGCFGLNCGGKGKLEGVFLALLALWVLALPAYAKYGGGSGTAEDPYLINTAEQMNAIGTDANDWDKHFKLTADINLGIYTGEEFNIIGCYIDSPNNAPYVNGASAEIKNLGLINPSIDAGTGGAVGALIGWIWHGNVSDCYVHGGGVVGESTVGGLIGLRNGVDASGTISNCYATCSVSGGRSVGGLLGTHGGLSPTTATMSNCYATGSVSGTGNVIGGLVGYNDALICDSYATGDVSSEAWYVGGLVGINGSSVPYLAIISRCSASGNVGTGYLLVGGLVGKNYGSIYQSRATGNVSSEGFRIGGLVGHNQAGDIGGDFGDANGIISESFATGTVTASHALGGLVSINDGGAISKCYATGSVTPTNPLVIDAAGLVALQEGGGTITNCYSTGHVSEGDIENGIGGLVGKNLNGSSVSNSFWDTQTSGLTESAGGTGRTTTQMQTLSTFTSAGWDFLGESANGTEDIWRLCVDGTDYPRLVWQKGMLGDFVCPDGVYMPDLALFAAHWLDDDCNDANDYCEGADLDESNNVNFADYALFAENWRKGLMPSVLDEDFETGDFTKYNWQHAGDANWVVVSDVNYEGSYSAKSGIISHNEESVLQITLIIEDGSVSFYCKVSSESDDDFLRFFIDDDPQGGWSGEQDWSLQEYVITSGIHTLKWVYGKDASISSGSDCAWIDKITITGVMP
ncbi:MAG: GLUG motif-containing protein [Planctomycetota bacterium]